MSYRNRMILVAAISMIVMSAAFVGCQASSSEEVSEEMQPSLSEHSSPSAVPAPAPKPAPKPVMLTDGTALQVRTNVTLSTETLENGDEFTATLTEPVVVDGRTIAEAGADVRGLVAESDPGGKVKGRAYLAVRLTALETTNWGMVDITTDTLSWEAEATKKRDAAKIGGAGGVGAIIGAIAGGGKGAAIGAVAGSGAGTAVVLATRGKQVEVPVESALTFRVSQSTQLGS